jgi:hypothetical protein
MQGEAAMLFFFFQLYKYESTTIVQFISRQIKWSCIVFVSTALSIFLQILAPVYFSERRFEQSVLKSLANPHTYLHFHRREAVCTRQYCVADGKK